MADSLLATHQITKECQDLLIHMIKGKIGVIISPYVALRNLMYVVACILIIHHITNSRFRHPPPMPAQPRPPVGADSDDYKRAAIISEKDLKEFDNLRLDQEDEGWAGAQGEIDYS